MWREREYTKEILQQRNNKRGIKNSGLVKIPTLDHDWLGSMNKAMGELFEVHKKDIS